MAKTEPKRRATTMTKAIQNLNNRSLVDRLDSSKSGSRFVVERRGDRSEQYRVKPKPMYRTDNITKRTLTALTGVPAMPPPTVESFWDTDRQNRTIDQHGIKLEINCA